MKRSILLTLCTSVLVVAMAQQKQADVIARGKMPAMAKDKNNTIHIVYGTHDSIMYMTSKNAVDFSKPQFVSVLPGLFASAMRGPQIAATDESIIITACTKSGNIFSFQKNGASPWKAGGGVNSNKEVAKEALMGLSADCKTAFAVFLGVKKPKGQLVYGAKSTDGGKSWSKNLVVYDSPEGSVCECCKPSVVVKGETVDVMFRNLVSGNRDLYVVQSTTAGATFGKAQKLGDKSWKLNGCPMDGGGLAVSDDNTVQTVWRREGKIYAAIIGQPEKEIGEGRGCTIETVNKKRVYAWSQNGEVTVVTDGGNRKNLGKGSLPSLKAISPQQVLCLWENDESIHAQIVNL